MLKLTTAAAAAALVVSTLVAQSPLSQTPPAQTPPAQTPPAQTPPAQTPPAQTSPTQAAPATPAQGRGRGPGAFPAQQRPPGDPAVVARGKALFGVTCALCHGADLRGGQLNGPNLLRSQLVLSDQAGELIVPVIRGGRPDKGMPPVPMPDDDMKAIAEYIHSMTALSPRQGMPPPSETPVVLDVLVGDAAAGRVYFEAKCSSCHSPAGDLQGIAARVADAKALQNLWVSGGSAGGRGGRGAGRSTAPNAPNPRAVTVAVTLPSGEKVEGRLLRLDDFFVSLSLADGTIRSFTRQGARPRVDVRDPLEPHRALLSVYTDKDMHDVTAFLATLR